MNALDKCLDTRINIIDQLLDVLFNKMTFNDYIEFVKNDRHIACYDHMLSYIDLKIYPSYLKRMLKDELLDIVEENIVNKIKELNI